MTRCLSQHVDAGCCEPVDLKVVTAELSPQTSRTSSVSWTQDGGVEVTQLPSTTLTCPVQFSFRGEGDNAIGRSSRSQSPSSSTVPFVSSADIAIHRTPAYPPKAPIQGARKMAPEGGLPEILLPYIAFCYDPRYARNGGP